MAQQVLEGMRVAALAADGFEQVELTRPVRALEKHGAEVEIVSLRPGSILGMNLLMPGKKVEVDRTIFTADPDHYDALLIPGGFVNPDLLRQSDEVLEFVRAFEAEKKPIATLCHGPWVLISARLVGGRRLASWPGIKDDVRNAGGHWVDEKVVMDDNWITSRGPQDLHAFDKAVVAHFARSVGRSAPGLIADMPLGRVLAGTLAAAAAGYAVQRTMRQRPHDVSRSPRRYGHVDEAPEFGGDRY